jgi:hypothetical protein
MICTACGHDAMDPEKSFCPECGAKLEPAAQVEPGTDAASESTAETTAETSVDVRMDVGQMSGGSKAVGLEVGQVAGDLVTKGDYVGGDQISATIGNVGAGGQVAVGKNIQQSGAGPAELSDAERGALEAAFAELDASIDGMDLPLDRKLVGREFLLQLNKAMLREDAPPEAGSIQVLGDWLVENLPGLKPGLGEVLGSPAGRRVLGLAGEAAEGWFLGRFG